jgi:hypothetical protein
MKYVIENEHLPFSNAQLCWPVLSTFAWTFSLALAYSSLTCRSTVEPGLAEGASEERGKSSGSPEHWWPENKNEEQKSVDGGYICTSHLQMKKKKVTTFIKTVLGNL